MFSFINLQFLAKKVPQYVANRLSLIGRKLQAHLGLNIDFVVVVVMIKAESLAVLFSFPRCYPVDCDCVAEL
jgi:hypothetical protein